MNKSLKKAGSQGEGGKVQGYFKISIYFPIQKVNKPNNKLIINILQTIDLIQVKNG